MREALLNKRWSCTAEAWAESWATDGRRSEAACCGFNNTCSQHQIEDAVFQKHVCETGHRSNGLVEYGREPRYVGM